MSGSQSGLAQADSQ